MQESGAIIGIVAAAVAISTILIEARLSDGRLRTFLRIGMLISTPVAMILGVSHLLP